MVAKEQAATGGAIRDGAAQQHEDDALYPEAGEPGGDAAEVPAELARLGLRNDVAAQGRASQPTKPAASTSAMGGSQRP